MTVLGAIIDAKQLEIERLQRRLPVAFLQETLGASFTLSLDLSSRDFFSAMGTKQGAIKVVAEVKRASPSKGVLMAGHSSLDWNPVRLAKAYERGGATCLSVLTDQRFFWGSDDTLLSCRAAVQLPVLRKDFVVDIYQVWHSAWLGVDALLLMCSVLPEQRLRECAELCHELSITPLIEIHSDAELVWALPIALDTGAVLGINHRDLHTLTFDMNRAISLRPKIPPQVPVIAESGIDNPQTLVPLTAAKIDGVLVGGFLASSADPEQALRHLLTVQPLKEG